MLSFGWQEQNKEEPQADCEQIGLTGGQRGYGYKVLGKQKTLNARKAEQRNSLNLGK